MTNYNFTCNSCGKVWTLSRREYNKIGAEENLFADAMSGAAGSNAMNMSKSLGFNTAVPSRELTNIMGGKRPKKPVVCPKCRSSSVFYEKVKVTKPKTYRDPW